MSLNLIEIMEGWMNVIKKDTPAIAEIALHRTEICIKCEYLDKKPLRKEICTKCGCPIIAKARSPKSKCPARKWKK